MNRLYMTITKSLIVVALLVQAIINTAKHWQSRKTLPAPQACQKQQEVVSMVEEEFQREEDFQLWYAGRVHQSCIILSETQVRRLYDAYLSNEKTIKSQVAEVVE